MALHSIHQLHIRPCSYSIRSNGNSATEIVESTMSTTDTSSNNSDLSSVVDSASETTDNIDLLKKIEIEKSG